MSIESFNIRRKKKIKSNLQTECRHFYSEKYQQQTQSHRCQHNKRFTVLKIMSTVNKTHIRKA